MEVMILWPFVSCVDRSIDAFDRALFHGIALDDGADDVREFVPNGMTPSPLLLYRPGNVVPGVFCPSCNAVVRYDILDRITQVFRLESIEVVFRKLAHVERPTRRKRLAEPSRSQWEQYPDVPVYHEKIGRYYELLSVSPRMAEIVNPAAFQGARPYSIETDMGRNDVLLSKQLFAWYPLVFVWGGIVMPRVMFDLIVQDIDWVYYGCSGPITIV